MADFTQQGERFDSRGLNTSQPPDGLSKGQFCVLRNVRGYSGGTLTTRPGHDALFSTSTSVENLVSYSSTPRYLAATSDGNIVLDDETTVDSGYAQTPIFAPYRPNQSPESWVYAASTNQYHKLRSPGTNGDVLVQKVGIAEPQSPVDAAIYESYFTPLATGPSIYYTHGGAFGTGITDTPKVNDTVVKVFQDPALPAGALNEYILQTASSTQSYQKAMFLSIGTPDVNVYQVKDIFLALVSPLEIVSIEYVSGTTGRCVIVPTNVGTADEENNVGQSIFSQSLLSSVRRGSLVNLGGTEVVMVLGTALSPNGTIAFECDTISTHIAGESITGVRSLRVLQSVYFNGGTPQAPTAGQAITAHFAGYSVVPGVSWIQSPIGVSNPFAYNGIAYQSSDYLHLSMIFQYIQNITEVKVLIDIGNGDFAHNYYYASFRPADFVAATTNTLTQLGVAQLSAQRAQIDLAAQEKGQNSSSWQMSAGDEQWSDIIFPISKLIRVGNDQTLSLLNAHAFRIQVTASANTGVGFHTLDVFGGFAPDIGNTGGDFRYRIRPRSSITGAKGNPSPAMRYGVNARRELVKVILPTPASAEFDLWDIFRIGGTVDKYTLCGTVASDAGEFLDNYSDVAIRSNEQLEFDNLEPWPTLDVPFTATGANGVGTIIRFALADANAPSANILRYLPGNLIQIGQQIFTLYTRPTIDAGIVTFQTLENVNTLTNVDLRIYEPLMANQSLPVIWGPSEQGGTIFGCGDPNRPGNVSFTKNFNPDSAPSKYTLELSPPDQPIVGGELLNGESFCFSATKCWALRPSFGGQNQWTQRQIPTGVGLIAPRAIATNGQLIFFVAKDGVYATGGGVAEPITNRENIYSLFPHDGAQGADYIYAGRTLYRPDYSQAALFRLTCANGFLYFDFPNTAGVGKWGHLVYDIREKAWYEDVFADEVHCHYAIPQVAGDALVLAGTVREIWQQAVNEIDAANTIVCAVATRENTGGDSRGLKLFGDVGVDLTPIETVTITPYTLNTASGTAQTYSGGARQTQSTVSLDGGKKLFSLGLLYEWTKAASGAVTTLFLWSASVIDKPETITDRAQDWTSTETLGNKFFQGFLLEADAFAGDITFSIQDSDTMTLHGPFTATFDGQQTKAFSFDTPFLAHSVRLVPQSDVPFEMFDIHYIYEPYPESATTWWTEGTGNFNDHFQFLNFYGEIMHVSTSDLTLTIRTDTFPDRVLTIPAGGTIFVPAKTKIIFPPTKAKIIAYTLTSDEPFFFFQDDSFVSVSAWESGEEAHVVRFAGGNTKLAARV